MERAAPNQAVGAGGQARVVQGKGRRKRGDRWVLPLALVLGIVAALLVVLYLRSLGAQESQPPIPTLAVVVAAQDIPAGQKITTSMVEVRQIPETAVVPNAATVTSQVLDQTLRYPLVKGEQVSKQRLVEQALVQALSFQIPPGLRGFTLPVSTTNSPAALTAPGDFVDVLYAPKSAEVAMTIIQNVQVLAVQRTRASASGPYDDAVRGTPPTEGQVNNVTLALTPEQAQTLWVALQEGRVTLILRAFGDKGAKDLKPSADPAAGAGR